MSEQICNMPSDMVLKHVEALAVLPQMSRDMDVLKRDMRKVISWMERQEGVKEGKTTSIALPIAADQDPEIAVAKGVIKVDLKKIDWARVTTIGAAIGAMLAVVWDKFTR